MPHPTPMKDDTTLTPSARRSGRHREQQDLNHLLGFTLPPRAPQPPTHLPRRSTRRNPNHAVFDRARFVHQFRFVVKPDKDYTVHFADPDIHIDWPDVLQVILPTSASALSSVATTKLDQSVAGDSGASSGVPACPICLSEPVAPRMTKCGHVYCYPCILHYLALAESGNKTRQCPICHDSVHSKDLKSVKWFFPDSPASVSAATSSPPASVEPVDADLARALELSRLDAQGGRSSTASESAPSSRERLRMRLIRRPQITTLALPRSATWPSTAVPPLRAPWNFTPDAFTYAKFFLGAPDYLRDELLAQKAQLEAEIQTLRRFGQRGGTDEQLGIVFIDAALRKVDEQLQKVELLKTTAVMTARKRSLRELHDIQQLRAADADDRLPPVTDTSASELEAASDVDASRTDDPSPAVARQPVPAPPVYDPIPLDFLHTRSTPLAAGAPPFTPPATAPPAVISATLSPPRTRTAQKRSSAPPTEQPVDDVAYYFYQAASGQPIFLSPLDIKILKSHFGTYQAMPDNIEVVVEGADEGSMNDELRRRCKWLGHLPVASDVVFIEADLSTVVPKKALAPYTTALRQRRTKRRDKARKEDRAKQRSEQKAAEALPVHESTYAFGAPGGLPFGFAAASSWDDDHVFPATSTSPGPGRSSSPRRAAAPFVADAPTRPSPSLPQAARPSFASAVHASSRSAGGSSSTQSAWDDALEDRWGQLEEEIGRRRAASPRTTAASSVSTPGEANSNGQGKKGKRAKKLTLHLSGSALRGAG